MVPNIPLAGLDSFYIRNFKKLILSPHLFATPPVTVQRTMNTLAFIELPVILSSDSDIDVHSHKLPDTCIFNHILYFRMSTKAEVGV